MEEGKLSMWIGRINHNLLLLESQYLRIILCWVLRTRMAEDKNLNVPQGVDHRSQGNNDEGIGALKTSIVIERVER